MRADRTGGAQVRSVTLDTWLPEQVAFMARTGNAAANAHREARLDPALKPPPASPELEGFIRRKARAPPGGRERLPGVRAALHTCRKRGLCRPVGVGVAQPRTWFAQGDTTRRKCSIAPAPSETTAGMAHART